MSKRPALHGPTTHIRSDARAAAQPGSQPDLREKPRRPVTFTLEFKNKMHLEFRNAVESDFEDICKLVPTEDELFLVYPRGTHPFSVEQVKHLAKTRKELTVVTVNNQIIGFSNLYDFKEKEHAFIGNVVIEKSLRKNGIGKKLIGYMLDIIHTKYELSEAHISVFSKNVPALLLYSNLGFLPYAIEERINNYGKRVPLIHMKRGRQSPEL